MKQFEYKKVNTSWAISTEQLNTLGSEGWELVMEHDYTWIFKRELPNDKYAGLP